MKNDIFNLKRFAKYFCLDLKNALSRYWIVLVVLMMAGLLDVLYESIKEGTFTNETLSSFGERKQFFGLLLVALSITMTVTCFGRLTQKKTGSLFSMLPVSIFEKSLSMILICAVVIPSLYTVGCLATDEIVVELSRNNLWHKELLRFCHSRDHALRDYYLNNFGMEPINYHYKDTNSKLCIYITRDTIFLEEYMPYVLHEDGSYDGGIINLTVRGIYQSDTLTLFNDGITVKKVFAGDVRYFPDSEPGVKRK